MRNALLLSLWLGGAAGVLAQAPPASKPTTPPAQAPRPAPPAAQAPAPKPAQPPAPVPKPAAPGTTTPAAPRRAAPAPTGRSGMAITATDPQGGTLAGVRVEVTGPSPRNGVSDSSGQLNFPGLQAGTYRLRFSGDTVTAFEREVVLRAGQIADIDVTLNPAAAPREVTAPPASAAEPSPTPAPAPAVGPLGEARVTSVVDLVERELISGREPRKDTLLACSGNTRSVLVQLNQPQAQRVYDAAESLYYIVAGEGEITMNGRNTNLEAGGYVSIPRGTPHSLTRKGRRPLIMLAVLSGEPCEEAR